MDRCLVESDGQNVITVGCHGVRRIVEKIPRNQVGHLDILQDGGPVGCERNMGIVPDLGHNGLQRAERHRYVDTAQHHLESIQIDLVRRAAAGGEIGDRQDSVCRAEVEKIVACATGRRVDAAIARETVVSAATQHDVVAVAAGNCVVAGTAVQGIVAFATDKRIAPAIAGNDIVAIRTVDQIVAIAAGERINAGEAEEIGFDKVGFRRSQQEQAVVAKANPHRGAFVGRGVQQACERAAKTVCQIDLVSAGGEIGDRVVSAIRRNDIRVPGAVAAGHRIVARAAIDRIAALSTDNDVVARAAVYGIAATAAIDGVVAVAAANFVAAAEPGDGVVSVAAVDQPVAAAAGDNRIVARAAIDGRVSGTPGYDVVSAVAVYHFCAARAAEEDVVALCPDPVWHVFGEVIGDQVIHVDILENDLEIGTQLYMGVVAHLRRGGDKFVEIPCDRPADDFPQLTVEVDPVGSIAARCEVGDGQGAGFRAHPEFVVSVSAGNDIVSAAAIDVIVAVAAIQNVVALAAGEIIGSRAARKTVVSVAAVQPVAAGAAHENVVAFVAVYIVVSIAAVDEIMSLPAVEAVVVCAAGDVIVPAGTGNPVGVISAGQGESVVKTVG